MDNVKIGAFIKKLRLENNMSQKDLAERIPIGRDAISKWENGKTIPDYQTLIILSKMLGVTIDELLYGERITNENKDKVKKVYYEIYNDRNEIRKKIKIQYKILLLLFLILIVSIFSFLFYYFFNSYDSVKVYTINSPVDKIYVSDGIMVLTRENIYFRFGNIEGINESKVSKVVLYYMKKNNKNIIYETDCGKDGLIRDYLGYNEYFNIENNAIFEALYLDIYLKDEVKSLQLYIQEDYSNKKLFFEKFKNNSNAKKVDLDLDIDLEIDKLIKNKFESMDGENYTYNATINKIKYLFNYSIESKILTIYWRNENFMNFYNYSLSSNKVFYEKKNDDLNNNFNCEFPFNKKGSSSCNVDIEKNFLNLIEILKQDESA